ncbi:MAG: glycosyltransferase [Flammeovirgaceae bacterium]|nr:glycosyltransferase [Flammeovirgaceae bacterium]|tara:strand:- start:6394 stop:7389 length:996 start_codon:yes stop_codon:yes gene_type:complete
MPKYSIIIPVFNRPDEIEELLASLTKQSFSDFEVVLVEDGSYKTCQTIAEYYSKQLSLRYFFKENEGQGYARNYGYQRAKGEVLIVFDSDCLIPPNYLQEVNSYLELNKVDAFGGPDTSLDSFTPIQRAISHTMTSFLTTGGIRGSKKQIGPYYPRSFNMGITQKVFQKTGGYRIPFMGEDLEFSIRIINAGFKTALIPNAFVYHKRRTNLIQFYKQINYFGRARINLARFHPGHLKILHFFPLIFVLGFICALILSLLNQNLGFFGIGCYITYLLLISLEALLKLKSLKVALYAPLITLIQMSGYAVGLIHEAIQKFRGVDPNKKYIDLY